VGNFYLLLVSNRQNFARTDLYIRSVVNGTLACAQTDEIPYHRKHLPVPVLTLKILENLQTTGFFSHCFDNFSFVTCLLTRKVLVQYGT
jgi:hypothetical protein